ncbi:hypothetical protein H1P_1230017 [Hyella patelloides LEGE 07179]|uniref:Leucine rich repeat variant n=1 Tax=Hyella patelloides LEGE 07179 TaxID=945734 RepID=A0A563VKD4_9CYAN|nr:hypothetical protein [Hyella patelloides]VEP11871.1 hypothetical protein H1P_1230017 [Hyella patelloides LEGE 07179]
MDIEQARQLAKDETTAPEILRELAINKDYQTRKSVAENPNTPTKILLNLGAEFPEELLDNPIFNLLSLENLNLIEELPFATKKSLLKCESVPQSLIEWAVKSSNEEILLALTINSITNNKILNNIVNSTNNKLAESARLHINHAYNNTQNQDKILVKSILRYYAINNRDNNIDIQLQQFLLNLRHARKYSRKTKINDLQSKVKLIQFPENIIKCSKNSFSFIRFISLFHSEISPSLLSQNAKSDCWLERYAIAQNPNTPLPIIKRLAKDGNRIVRAAAKAQLESKH